MSIHFRPIHADEIPDMCRLVDSVYAAQVKKLFGNSANGRWTHYAESKVQSYFEREPDGVRIGVVRGQMATVCVCRSFGSLGWFHTLGVHRNNQGQGLGAKAVSDAQRYLAGQGVQTVGLMTWPVALSNIGFYQSLGYRAVGMSVHGYRRTSQALITGPSPVQAVRLSTLNDSARQQALAAIALLCDSCLGGLDYSAWMTWTLARDLGDVLALGLGDRLIGFVLAYTRFRQDWLEAKLLVMAPDCGLEEQVWAFEHLRRWAAKENRSSFGFPVDLMNSNLALRLQQGGFRFFGQTMLNMVRGDHWPPKGIHLVRFSG